MPENFRKYEISKFTSDRAKNNGEKMDIIKKYFITKWIREYIEEIRQYELICDEAVLADMQDLRGDLEICEKVILRFYSIIND